MNAWINLLVSSALAGLGVGWASAQGGSSGKGATMTGLSAFLAALVQHLRQSPDLNV